MAQHSPLGNHLQSKFSHATPCRATNTTVRGLGAFRPQEHLMNDPGKQMPVMTREMVLRHLVELGIETKTVDHPAVFSVADSDDVYRELAGGHTKNLFLKDAKGALFLIVAHSETKVDLKQVAVRLGCARLSFGKPPLLLEVLGVTPGSVTAFALINDTKNQVRAIFDDNLMCFERVNCHPMENTATTNIAREDLFRFIRATGHVVETINLEAAKRD